MPTTETPAATERESWRDWMPDTPATMTTAELARFTNARLDTGTQITVDDLEAWEADGILPRSSGRYPPLAWRLIETLLEQEREGTDPEFMRSVLRHEAGVINGTVKRAVSQSTWLDWLGPDAPFPSADNLYTREEIAERASATGIDPVSSDDLRFWEYQGVLPRSIRRRHKGATRAIYPGWYVELTHLVRQLQRRGESLSEIRPQVRERARALIPKHPHDSQAIGSAEGIARTVAQTAAISVAPTLPPDLVSALNAFAEANAQHFGSPVAAIELTIALKDGRGRNVGIPVESTSNSKSQ